MINKIKYKTNSSYKKRFKINKNGEIKFKHSMVRHNLTKKSRKYKIKFKFRQFIKINHQKKNIKHNLCYL